MKVMVNLGFTLGSSLNESWEIVLDALQLLHVLLHDPARLEQLIETGIDKDELHALSSSLTTMFIGSVDLPLPDLIQLLERLDTRARRKLFPVAQQEQQVLEQASRVIVESAYSFELSQILEIVRINMSRIADFWDLVNDLLSRICNHSNLYVRAQGVLALSQIVETGLQSHPTPRSERESTSVANRDDTTQRREKLQWSLLVSLKALASSPYQDVREVTMDQVYNILQVAGHNLTSGWPFVLCAIKISVGGSADVEGNSSVASSSSPQPLSPPKPRHLAKAFNSLQYICTDFLSALPHATLPLLIETIGVYGVPMGDINVAITAVGGLLWNVSDFLSSPGFKAAADPTIRSSLWLEVFSQLRQVSVSPRHEIRTASLRALFGILMNHGADLTAHDWRQVLTLLYEILDIIALRAREIEMEEAATEATDSSARGYPGGGENVSLSGNGGSPAEASHTRRGKRGKPMRVHHSQNSRSKQWTETRVIALEGVFRLFKAFFETIRDAFGSDATKVWHKLLAYVDQYWHHSSIEIALAGMKAVETLLVASIEVEDYPHQLWEQGIRCYHRMGTTLDCKESVLSHTTINAISSSVRRVYEQLHHKFTLADYHVFLATLLPLPTLPVEYAGELSMLHSALMSMLPQIAADSPQTLPHIFSLLVTWLSASAPLDYTPTCYVPPPSLSSSLLSSQSSSSAGPSDSSPPPAKQNTVDSARKVGALAEKSVKALYGLLPLWQSPNVLAVTSDVERGQVFIDLSHVIGRLCSGGGGGGPSDSVWAKQAVPAFVSLCRSEFPSYLRAIDLNSSQEMVAVNVTWTDLLDTAESCIHHHADNLALVEPFLALLGTFYRLAYSPALDTPASLPSSPSVMVSRSSHASPLIDVSSLAASSPLRARFPLAFQRALSVLLNLTRHENDSLTSLVYRHLFMLCTEPLPEASLLLSHGLCNEPTESLPAELSQHVLTQLLAHLKGVLQEHVAHPSQFSYSSPVLFLSHSQGDSCNVSTFDLSRSSCVSTRGDVVFTFSRF